MSPFRYTQKTSLSSPASSTLCPLTPIPISYTGIDGVPTGMIKISKSSKSPKKK